MKRNFGTLTGLSADRPVERETTLQLIRRTLVRMGLTASEASDAVHFADEQGYEFEFDISILQRLRMTESEFSSAYRYHLLHVLPVHEKWENMSGDTHQELSFDAIALKQVALVDPSTGEPDPDELLTFVRSVMERLRSASLVSLDSYSEPLYELAFPGKFATSSVLYLCLEGAIKSHREIFDEMTVPVDTHGAYLDNEDYVESGLHHSRLYADVGRELVDASLSIAEWGNVFGEYMAWCSGYVGNGSLLPLAGLLVHPQLDALLNREFWHRSMAAYWSRAPRSLSLAQGLMDLTYLWSDLIIHGFWTGARSEAALNSVTALWDIEELDKEAE